MSSKLDEIQEIVKNYPTQHNYFVEIAQDGSWYSMYQFANALLNQQRRIYEAINAEERSGNE